VAGAAAALSLSESGWETIVLDGGHSSHAAIGGETLPGAARPLLERLGVLDAFAHGPHLAARARRSCWGEAAPAERSALFTPYGGGWHLQRERFDAMLRDAATARGARFLRGRMRSIARDGRSFELSLGDAPRRVRARGVVDATGRTAAVARRLGAVVKRSDRLVAACARSAGEIGAAAADERDAVSFVEATRDGWWYSAPTPEGVYAVQFVTLPELWSAERRMSARLACAPHTAARVGELAAEPPNVVVAHSASTSPSAGRGWVAVGDAAGAYDPLASAGLLSAMLSGMRAAQALATWLREGDATLLDTYAAMQQRAFERYLDQRARLYASERRWPRAPFWTSASGPAMRDPALRRSASRAARA